MGLTFKKPEGTAGKAWPAIAIGMFVAFGGVLFGYVESIDSLTLTIPCGSSSDIYKKIRHRHNQWHSCHVLLARRILDGLCGQYWPS